MAKIKQGILGGFSGKVGPVIGSSWKGKATMRALALHVHQPRTLLQLAERARFGLIGSFLSNFTQALAVGWKLRENGTTAQNEAMRYNLANALTGTYPQYDVDYQKVRVSDGNLVGADNATASDNGSGGCDVSWIDNSGVGNARPDDGMLFCIYYKTKDEAVTRLDVAERSDGSFVYTYPVSWSGDTAYVWIGFRNSAGTCSRSQYLAQIVCS